MFLLNHRYKGFIPCGKLYNKNSYYNDPTIGVIKFDINADTNFLTITTNWHTCVLLSRWTEAFAFNNHRSY